MEREQPKLSNAEILTIVNGIELLRRFQSDIKDYSNLTVIDVLKEQKKELEKELETVNIELTITKEHNYVLKQKIEKLKPKRGRPSKKIKSNLIDAK